MLFVALVKEQKKPAGRSDIKIRGGTKWSGALSNSNFPPPPPRKYKRTTVTNLEYYFCRFYKLVYHRPVLTTDVHLRHIWST